MTTPEIAIFPFIDSYGTPRRSGNFFRRDRVVINLDEEYAPPLPDDPNYNPFSGLLADLTELVKSSLDEDYLIFGYRPPPPPDPNVPDVDPPYEFSDLFTVQAAGGLYFNGPALDLEGLRASNSPTSWTFTIYVASTETTASGNPRYYGQVDTVRVTINLRNVDESAPRIIYDDPALFIDKQVTESVTVETTDDHTNALFQFGVESGTGDFTWSIKASRKNAFVGDQISGVSYFDVDENGDVYWKQSPFEYSRFNDAIMNTLRFKVVVTDSVGKTDEVEVIIRVEVGDRTALDVMKSRSELSSGVEVADLSHVHGRDYTNHQITSVADDQGNRLSVINTFSFAREWDYSSGNRERINTGRLEFEGTNNNNIKHYVITLTAMHDGQQYTLTVKLYVNEAPAITSSHNDAILIAENADNNMLVTTVTATDPDDQDSSLTYAIIDGNIGRAFSINNDGQITINDASQLDFETHPIYTLTVAVSDRLGERVTTDITITLTDIDEPPVIISDAGMENHVSRQADAGTVITRVEVNNPESATALSFTITAGNSSNLFAIDNQGQITLTAALPDNSADSYPLTVTVTDGVHTLTHQLIIVVNDAAPQITSIHTAPLSFAEDTALESVITTVTATDADNDELHYAIIAGDEVGRFAIDGNGVITLKRAFDYEQQQDFTLTVQVTDGAHSIDVDITISVTDVNDVRPSITSNHQTRVILQTDAEIGTEIATVTAIDADTSDLTYRIKSGDTHDLFAIDADTGIITLRQLFNDQTSALNYQLIIEVSDGDFTSQTRVTIAVNDNAPVFDRVLTKGVGDQTFNVKDTVTLIENTAYGINAAGALILALDADGDMLTYTIISGDPDGYFQINPFSNGRYGRLSIAKPLDYEQYEQHVLTIEVSDGVFTARKTLTVNVQDVVERPIITSTHDAALSISEDAANDALVTQVIATDADNDDTSLRFAITAGNTGNAFRIESDGKIKVNDATQLDFEIHPQYALTITVTDIQGVTAQITVHIALTDINEPHVITSDHSQDISLSKQSDVGVLVTRIIVDNPEGQDVLTYRITGGDTNNRFAIDQTGRITLAAVFTSGDADQYTLAIEITDGIHTVEQDITITINDHAPQITSTHTAPIRVAENIPLDTIIASVIANDADQDILQFSIISGNDDGHFAIDDQGVIRLINLLDAETQTQYTLTVDVSDGAHHIPVEIMVNVANVNDVAPVIASDHSDLVVLRKDTGIGRVIATIEASDEDSSTLTYTISRGNPHRLFSIDQNGVLTLKTAHNASPLHWLEYHLVISVSDGDFTEQVSVDIAFNDNQPYFTNFFNDGDTNGLIYSLPHFQLTDTISLNENTQTGQQLAVMNVKDRDDDTITVSIAEGNEDGLFRIERGFSAGRYNLKLNKSLDFETASQHVLVIRLTDGAYVTETTFTINVTDDTTEIARLLATGMGHVAENIDGAETGITLSFADIILTDAPLTWAITGDDAVFFEVVQNPDQSGQWLLKLKSTVALDYETKASHALTITATQGDTILQAQATVTVTKTFISFASGSYAAEPHGMNLIYLKEDFRDDPSLPPILRYTPNDANSEPAVYRIISGDPDGVFAFSSQADQNGVLKLVKALDYETKARYDLTIEITYGTYSEQRSFTVVVDDTATLNSHGDGRVSENVKGANAGFSFTFTDLVVDNRLTWNIAGEAADLFEVVAHPTTSGEWVLTLKADASLDREAHSYHVLTITATQGRMVTQTSVEVIVTNVNEAPLFSQASYSGAVREDYDIGQVITLNPAISASDEDGDVLTYTIISGNDAGLFSINSAGDIVLAQALDFETATRHDLRIAVSDGSYRAEADVTIHVTNQDDGPARIGISGGAGVDLADLDIGDVLSATILTPDPDGIAPNTGQTWRWFHRHNPDVNIGTGESYTITEADRGAQIGVELTYVDSLDAVITGKSNTKVSYILDDIVPRVVLQQSDAEKEDDKAITLPDTATEVDAGDGSDTITGGDGNDEITGGKGDDNIDLGADNSDTDVVIYGIGGQSARDGGDNISNFNRGVDQFIFSLDSNAQTNAITDYDSFLDYITKGTATLDDDEFRVQLNLGKDAGGNTQIEGLFFHFASSTFYSGGRASLPLMKINFAEPIGTAGIMDIFTDEDGQQVDASQVLNKYFFITDLDYLDDFMGGANSIGYMVIPEMV